MGMGSRLPGGRERGWEGSKQLPGSGDALPPRPCAKWTPRKSKTQRMTGSGTEHEEGHRTQGRRRDPRQENPQGLKGTWVQDEGGNRGGKRTRDTAVDAGTRRGEQGERQRLAGGGCGWRPVGRCSVLGKEVGDRCD